MKKALLAVILFALSYSVFAGCTKKDAVGWWAVQDQKTVGTIFFGWNGNFYQKEFTDSTFENRSPVSHGAWAISANCIMTLNTANKDRGIHDDHEPEFKQSFIILVRTPSKDRTYRMEEGLFSGGSMSRLR